MSIRNGFQGNAFEPLLGTSDPIAAPKRGSDAEQSAMHDPSGPIDTASTCNVVAFCAIDDALTGNDAEKSAAHGAETVTVAPFWGNRGALTGSGGAFNGSDAV